MTKERKTPKQWVYQVPTRQTLKHQNYNSVLIFKLLGVLVFQLFEKCQNQALMQWQQ